MCCCRSGYVPVVDLAQQHRVRERDVRAVVRHLGARLRESDYFQGIDMGPQWAQSLHDVAQR
jgi:hypothetical protein